MREVLVSMIAIGGLAGFWVNFGSSSPARPAVVGNDLGGTALEALEAQVSRAPGDADALYDLAEIYLNHDAPGLAQAALERAPQELQMTPRIADARARVLWGLGATELALEVERSVLDSCQTRACPVSLVVHAERRKRLFTEVLRLGVEDPKEDPNRVLLAYRLSTREVTLVVE